MAFGLDESLLMNDWPEFTILDSSTFGGPTARGMLDQPSQLLVNGQFISTDYQLLAHSSDVGTLRRGDAIRYEGITYYVRSVISEDDGEFCRVHLGKTAAGGVPPNVTEEIQILPTSVWTFAHSLGYAPRVRVFNEVGEEIEATVTATANDVQIFFSSPTAGKAWLYETVPAAFTYSQPSPAAVWLIQHRLGYVPRVDVFELDGVEVDAQVDMTEQNCIVTFNQPTAGYANLY